MQHILYKSWLHDYTSLKNKHRLSDPTLISPKLSPNVRSINHPKYSKISKSEFRKVKCN